MSFSGSSPGKMAGFFFNAIDCCTLAADSGWNTVAQLATFLHGLAEPIKDQLAPLELPSGLDSLITMAIHIDTLVVEREKQGPSCHASSRPEGAVMLSASILASPPRVRVHLPRPQCLLPSRRSPCRWAAPSSHRRNHSAVYMKVDASELSCVTSCCHVR